MNKRGGYGGGSEEVDGVLHMTKNANMVVTGI